jgi:excisionase family DNA binding protein
MKKAETLSIAQAAKLLGVTRQRLYQRISEGSLASCTTQKPERRILTSVVEAELARRKTEPKDAKS